MTLPADFAKLQAEMNKLIYHYTRFTEKGIKGESSEVRKSLMNIINTSKEMRASTQAHKEKM